MRLSHISFLTSLSSPTSELLYLLRHSCDVRTLNKLHSSLIVSGLSRREPCIASLIHGYVHSGNPAYAVSAFCAVKSPTSELQNFILRCLSDQEMHGILLSLYAELQGRGCCIRTPQSDQFAFPIVIKACGAESAPLAGKELHGRILRSGHECNRVVQTALVGMYAKTCYMEYAKRVFDKMAVRDLVSWNALLSGYSSNFQHKQVLLIFREILEFGWRPNASTLVSAIPVCLRLGAKDTGMCLHGLAVKTGADYVPSLTPTLMSMYSGFGDMDAAVALFKEMPHEKDVISWNSVISSNLQNGRWDAAAKAFQQMLSADIKPTIISLVSVMSASGNLPQSIFGKSLHACAIKHGFQNKTSIITSLLSMYSKLASLDAAMFLFGVLPEKKILAFNCMISGYVLNSCWDLALETFWRMQLSRVMPDSVTMVSVLIACCKLKSLHWAKSAHSYCLRNGFDFNPNVMNVLMTTYAELDHLSFSLKLFNLMADKNLSSWNTMISASAQSGIYDLSISLFRKMQDGHETFDIVTIISILPVFDRDVDIAAGQAFHCHAIKAGCYSDIALVNALINMYMKCDNLSAGYQLFKSMPVRDVVSWNIAMTGLRNKHLDHEVVTLFNEMQVHGVTPNAVTLLNIFPICRSQLIGKVAHGYSIRNLLVFDDTLITSIMCMYSRFANMRSCLLLFDMANKQKIVIWNAMLFSYLITNNTDAVIVKAKEMLRLGLQPDHVTVLSLLSACAQSSDEDTAPQTVLCYVIKNGFEKATPVSNSLIDMLSKTGNLSKAREIFDAMHIKDLASWSSMINGYGLHGNGKAAFGLYTEMVASGDMPDDVTFLSILSACSHAGLVEEGRTILRSMIQDYHIMPKTEHLSCMVDLLSRTGHLDEAYELVRNAGGWQFKPTSSMLESVLGACIFHNNTAVGEKVGKMFSESEPNSAKSYVMLSNIYAAAGRWSDSCKVRSVMEAKGLRKELGLSVI